MTAKTPLRSFLHILVATAALCTCKAAFAAPVVWAIDDGEKIKETAPPPPLATGVENPIWSPGAPIRLFAMKNETVSFQIVVHADATELPAVTVDLESLTNGAATMKNAPSAADPTRYVGRPIERFVEHFFDIPRPSGGKTPRESLGWAPGSGPDPTAWVGRVPDALIPVEVAPVWSPYPMKILPQTNGIVWIDITVGKGQAAGLYRGNVIVKSAGTELGSLPIELDVVDITLPDRPVKTMLHYDKRELDRRLGEGEASDAAEKHLFRLLHRHRLTPMHSALGADEVKRRTHALDGTLYTTNEGYEGPAEGMGDGVLALGAYGGLGEPDPSKLAVVEAIANVLEERKVASTTDTFVYAIDEDCESTYGAKWKALLGGAKGAAAKKIRVGWTCSEDADKQVVDVVMQAATFDATKTARARALGKEVWAYNGKMPQTGTFVTDAPAISTRVNGWLSGMFDIGRWFFWEVTFWYDDNRGGKGPYDPFVTPETFHNKDGDYSMGDGVLVYPGKQVDRHTEHSIGMNGVIASIRLKNWRRGIQDAGYLQLARAADPKRADEIAKRLLPVVMSAATDGKRPSWSDASKPWFVARKDLLALVPKGTNGGPGLGALVTSPPPAATTTSSKETGRGCRGCTMAKDPVEDRRATLALGLVAVGFGLRRSRRTSKAARDTPVR